MKAKISKVRHLRAVFTVNTPTLHSRVQSYSDNIHIFPFIATDISVQLSPFHEIQVEKPEDDEIQNTNTSTHRKTKNGQGRALEVILQVSRVLEKNWSQKGFEKKIENRRGFGFYCRF